MKLNAATSLWRFPNISILRLMWLGSGRKILASWLSSGLTSTMRSQVTFAQIAERSDRAANAFASAGITKGERVLLMLPRLPEWWEAAWG